MGFMLMTSAKWMKRDIFFNGFISILAFREKKRLQFDTCELCELLSHTLSDILDIKGITL